MLSQFLQNDRRDQFPYRVITVYLGNKSLRVDGLSADNVRGCPKNEYFAEKRSFEGKYEILSKPKRSLFIL